MPQVFQSKLGAWIGMDMFTGLLIQFRWGASN